MSIIIDTEEIVDSISKMKKVVIPFEDYEKLISLLKNHSIDISDNINVNTINQSNQRRIFGSAKGKYELSDDFDAPINDFDEW